MGMDSEETQLILGIETSCDETSAAVVKNGKEILSNIISSQIDLHKKYGGVVPELASRKHVENIIPVIEEALLESGVSLSDIDLIGVTRGPGLIGALLIGLSAAKAISYVHHIPLIGVNHIEGHIYANFLEDPNLTPPFICLVVSGGHTHIVYIKDHCEYEIMGVTRDDAAGEAFDKTARILGLSYPGGPAIDKISVNGDPKAYTFPKAYLEPGSFDFSFSGIKTSVMNLVNTIKQRGEEVNTADVAASFQEAVVEILVEKTLAAAELKNVETVILAGGVAANSRLRNLLKESGEAKGFKIKYPRPILCTDNAAMIASTAYFRYKKGESSDLDLIPVANLAL